MVAQRPCRQDRGLTLCPFCPVLFDEIFRNRFSKSELSTVHAFEVDIIFSDHGTPREELVIRDGGTEQSRCRRSRLPNACATQDGRLFLSQLDP